MRVIGGEFRSRRLKSLPGEELRPTPDRLRESLFSVLARRLAGCTFVDAYAGCGAVGIEALSRGAARAVFIEKHRPAVRVIEENLKALGAERRAVIVCGPALKHLDRLNADIVFLDPPYALEREYRQALRLLGLAVGLDSRGRACPALVVVQHSARLHLEESYGDLTRTRTLKQGDNVLTFFEPCA